ncbi:NAD-P-binding protein [Trametes meyenii]|nr:NAD-P-binding protein [Trametes meyenii]
MPAISAPSTVLVTGSNGFIGQWAVYDLLARGYTVHAVVRSAPKVQTLVDWVARKLPDAVTRFKGIVVPDITAPGAFDEAIKGIDGVVHTASPIEPPVDDPQAFIQPAVEGTLSILRSALKSNVKRIVITTSVNAIVYPYAVTPRTYTEAEWNDPDVKRVEKEGAAAPSIYKYNASKVLAERAAWDFVEKHKSEISFDLATIAPSWVFGPVADDRLASPAALTATPSVSYRNLFAVPPPAEHQPKDFNYVDVRDVSELHVRALELEAAGGERIIASSELSNWEEWLVAIGKLSLLPKIAKVDSVPSKDPLPIAYLSNEKSKRLFGFKYRSYAETAKDLTEDFKSRGWLKELE